jgi:tRNA threonylcarbamoyladenosine biosynthesis protein TsaB
LRILAVDTATERGSVALLSGTEVVGEVRFRPRESHSVSLLAAVSFLLDGEGVRPAELDGFAVTLGPGSFTGLRVGISTVQGLALGAGRPSVGFCTLDVLASRIVGSASRLVSAVDGYRKGVFACFYDGEARREREPLVLTAEDFIESLPTGAALIGDGILRHQEAILARRKDVSIPRRSLFLAGSLARLAAPRLEAGEGQPASALSPLYLSEADVRPKP